MLVLNRRVGETIVIGDDIRITVVQTSASTARLGIDAPRRVPVLRDELRRQIAARGGASKATQR